MQDVANTSAAATNRDPLAVPQSDAQMIEASAGTGKTSIIHAFAHEMMEKNEKFRFIQLMGGDIHASLVGVAEKIQIVAFFQFQ